MRVSDILRQKGSEVATIRPDASIAEAAEILAVRRIGALVVRDDSETITGILNERDVVRHLAEHGAEAPILRVAEAMTRTILTCAPDDTLESLAITMTNERTRHLPVLEDGQLIGIVSIGDVVKRRVEQLENENVQLTDYIQTGR